MDRYILLGMSSYTDNARLGRLKVLPALEIEEHASGERPIKAPHTAVDVLGQSLYDSSGPSRG